MTQLALFSAVCVLIFGFALTNGFLDGGGIVSTVITTRTLDPLPALLLVACCEVLGVFLFGRAVVRTIAVHMILFPAAATPYAVLTMLFSAMVGALLWNTAMWRLSLPSSSSHALLGGLLGATWAHFGPHSVAWPTVWKVLGGLLVVPLIGLGASFLLARFIYWLGEFLTPAVGGFLRGLHVVVLAGVALVHGSNDGQKSMALVLLAISAWGVAPHPQPLSLGRGMGEGTLIALACGLAIGLGVLIGSRRTVRTVGQGFYRVRSLQGLCAETSAMVLVGVSSLLGFPMATSHVMSSAVLGAGAAVRPRGVRWNLAGGIVLGWLFTIPAAATLAALLSYVVSKKI